VTDRPSETGGPHCMAARVDVLEPPLQLVDLILLLSNGFGSCTAGCANCSATCRLRFASNDGLCLHCGLHCGTPEIH